jgi:hypothetical protein
VVDKDRRPVVALLPDHQVEERALGAAEARAIGEVDHRSRHGYRASTEPGRCGANGAIV